MKNSKIENIITNKILGEASSDELMILESWRSESSENENLYQEYAAIWNASANYAPIDFQSKAESAYQKHINLLAKEENTVVTLAPNTSTEAPKVHSKTKIFTFRTLASIAALFVLAFGAMVVFNSTNATTISAENGVTFASLEDGSSIWLDQGSRISYSSGFGKDHRDIQLEGKAFFDVQRNEDIAFKITSNDIKVAVLGTSFTVDAKDGKNIVSVKSGKVSVSAQNKEVTLLADQKIRFENNTFIQESVTKEDIVWRNSTLSFNNAPLSQVIADINLFHENKIVLNSDIKNLDCPFTARSLANTSFENIIEILKITYDLKTESQEEGKVSLTITECK